VVAVCSGARGEVCSVGHCLVVIVICRYGLQTAVPHSAFRLTRPCSTTSFASYRPLNSSRLSVFRLSRLSALLVQPRVVHPSRSSCPHMACYKVSTRRLRVASGHQSVISDTIAAAFPPPPPVLSAVRSEDQRCIFGSKK